jgi:hypothetical protein
MMWKLKNSNDDEEEEEEDINRAWESIRENAKSLSHRESRLL